MKKCRRGHSMTVKNTYLEQNGKAHCRRCKSVYGKAYWLKNKKKMRAQNKAWFKKNRLKMNAYMRSYMKDYRA